METVVDTSGLSPRATRLANLLAAEIGEFSDEELDAQLVGLARLIAEPGERGPATRLRRLTLASDLHNNLLALPDARVQILAGKNDDAPVEAEWVVVNYDVLGAHAERLQTRDGTTVVLTLPETQTLPGPGDTIRVAIRLLPNRGWHTYWRHSGDVGSAPVLAWRLPDGFSRRFSVLLNAGTRPFHFVNYLGSCGGALAT